MTLQLFKSHILFNLIDFLRANHEYKENRILITLITTNVYLKMLIKGLYTYFIFLKKQLTEWNGYITFRVVWVT